MANPDEKSAEGPAAPTTASSLPTAQPAVAEDDSDPDFDDLDDVLDQFSANAPSQPKPSTSQPPPPQPVPVASGPGRPSQAASEATIPSAQQPEESEPEFIERLSKEMSTMFESLAGDPSQQMKSPEDMNKLTKQLEEFTYQMEKEGIQPQDLLKAILGEEEGAKIASLAEQERENKEKNSAPSSSSQPSSTVPPSKSAAQPPTSEPTTSTSTKPQPKSFEDTIRKTISRLGESDKSATSATQQSAQKTEEDLLADMLRSLDAGPSGDSSGGGDDNLSKMFLDMMQQLTHRDLLYEPMKELHSQYPSWLAANKDKLDAAEFERFQRQSVIVADITRKFEEPGFSDDDPRCREFVWEKMQRMQDEGAPPEELVKNPFPGTDFGGGIPGLGGGGGDQLPEGLSKELEDGCPTQ